MPEIHLIYGGSSAARTLACPAWPRIFTESPARPHSTSSAAERGTLLHSFMEAYYRDGTPLADAVGLWKELADARRGGSGFSFNDIAADRAGTRHRTREPVCRHANPHAALDDGQQLASLEAPAGQRRRSHVFRSRCGKPPT